MKEVVKAYRQTGTFRGAAKICNTNWQKVRKILITLGEYSNKQSELIGKLYDEGKSEDEIAEHLNISPSTVNSYLPYSKGEYLAENPTPNAQRIRKYRKNTLA